MSLRSSSSITARSISKCSRPSFRVSQLQALEEDTTAGMIAEVPKPLSLPERLRCMTAAVHCKTEGGVFDTCAESRKNSLEIEANFSRI